MADGTKDGMVEDRTNEFPVPKSKNIEEGDEDIGFYRTDGGWKDHHACQIGCSFSLKGPQEDHPDQSRHVPHRGRGPVEDLGRHIEAPIGSRFSAGGLEEDY